MRSITQSHLSRIDDIPVHVGQRLCHKAAVDSQLPRVSHGQGLTKDASFTNSRAA